MELNWGVLFAACRRGDGGGLGGHRQRDRRRQGRRSERRRLRGGPGPLRLLPAAAAAAGHTGHLRPADRVRHCDQGRPAQRRAHHGPDDRAALLFAAIPIAFGGLLSAIAQGNTACAAINMIAKKPEESGKGMLMTIMVETYAVLSLLISFLLVNGVQV